MKFVTDTGEEYDVDLKAKTGTVTKKSGTAVFEFDRLSSIYVGSSEGKFLQGDRDAHVVGEIISLAGAPEEFVTPEFTNNILVYTRNSVYEIDQEQKLFRRLLGLNPSCQSTADGDWIKYTNFYLELGHVALFDYLLDNEPHNVRTSRVRKIHGTVVGQPPTPDNMALLADGINSILAAAPELE